ncbi:MAG: ankyrin repeat domain-containing protein [Bacteroidota bacterium]
MRSICIIVSFFFFQSFFGQQNVFDVARKGTVDEMKAIVKQNPEAVNSVNEEGYSPLILACYKGNLTVAEYLVLKVKNINGSSSMGTPLMAAVVKKYPAIVKLLLENNADVNIADANGTTALIYAAMFKNYDIALLLIKAKASPDAKDNRGNSALDYAILANDDKLIEILKTKQI